MTTGTRSSGSITTGSNASGPYKDYNNSLVKTWTGQDYPPGRPKPLLLPEPKVRIIGAWEGSKYVETSYPILYDAFTARKPRRAYTTEHTYNTSIIERHDKPVTYRGNPMGAWSSGNYPFSQMGFGFQSNSDASYGWTASHDLQMLGKLRDKIAGSPFNAGVFLGEGKEALNMMFDRARSLYWGYRAFRQGDLRSAARYLTRNNDRKKLVSRETPASNWLELQYGWLPLLADMHDGARFLAHHLDTPLQHVVKVSTTSHGVTDQSFLGSTFAKAVMPVNYRISHLKVIIKEKDVYKLSGLTDPLSVAWELVPYSFVIDWVLPIGDYLACRGLASSLEGSTVVHSLKRVRSFTGLIGINGAEFSPLVAPSRAKDVLFERRVNTTLQVPLPEVIPLSEAFSWKRAANAVALLSQLIR